ncbi:MAG TPA: hypothetical protein VHM91_09625 [Verrucomicrobiales bacterium]|jgi:YHS domain-containing protein|nr:hypothetical protein [Verrucomicrobiales bacterium]
MKTIFALLALSVLAPSGVTVTPAAAAEAAGKTKPYPLNTCIVSGNKLGSMGTVQSLVHEGQEIKFCCKPCVGKFKKDPAKYLAKLKK